MFSLRVHREPAFQDPLALVEHFLDGPEGREGKDTEERGYQDVADKQGTDDAQDAQH